MNFVNLTKSIGFAEYQNFQYENNSNNLKEIVEQIMKKYNDCINVVPYSERPKYKAYKIKNF